MAKKKKDKTTSNNSKKVSESSEENKREHLSKNYEMLIKRLKEERDNLQTEMNHEYREARRYVRENPEEGVLIAFAGGIVLGYVLGKLGK
ncbi:MAG TPA: DUF883 C-terminal domain-containing protein [Balneolaceae bacterium]|nr:DUF883 C-terminal domain-containing protein [Balneolaceae bacterium]